MQDSALHQPYQPTCLLACVNIDCPSSLETETKCITCVVQFVSNFLADPGFFGVPLMMRLGLAATPTWLSHMTGNAVMDGDGVLLYGQARQ